MYTILIYPNTSLTSNTTSTTFKTPSPFISAAMNWEDVNPPTCKISFTSNTTSSTSKLVSKLISPLVIDSNSTLSQSSILTTNALPVGSERITSSKQSVVVLPGSNTSKSISTNVN